MGLACEMCGAPMRSAESVVAYTFPAEEDDGSPPECLCLGCYVTNLDMLLEFDPYQLDVRIALACLSEGLCSSRRV